MSNLVLSNRGLLRIAFFEGHELVTRLIHPCFKVCFESRVARLDFELIALSHSFDLFTDLHDGHRAGEAYAIKRGRVHDFLFSEDAQ